jgi:polysaccharide export outer membrane protein
MMRIFALFICLTMLLPDIVMAGCCGRSAGRRVGGCCYTPVPNPFRRPQVVESRKCPELEFQFINRCCRGDYQKQCTCCGCCFRVSSYCCDPATCIECPMCGYPCKLFDDNGCCDSCCSDGCCGGAGGAPNVLGDVNPFTPIISKYTITAGDVLTVSAVGIDDLNGAAVTVAPDGYLYFSFLSGMYVEGLTVNEVQTELKKRLEDFFVDPQVTVVATFMSTQTYSVMGRVNSPGVFYLDQTVTLREAILQAGGIMEDVYSPRFGVSGGYHGGYAGGPYYGGFYGGHGAYFGGGPFFGGGYDGYRGGFGLDGYYGGYNGIPAFGGQTHRLTNLKQSYVLRDGVKIRPDFDKLLYSADNSQNMLIKPGDYIYLAPSEARDIIILGATGNPGYIQYEEGMTITQALLASGGWLDGSYGADTQRILLIRGSLKCPQVMPIDLCCILHGKVRDVYIEPGDVIFIANKQFGFGRELVELALTTIIYSFSNNLGQYYAQKILD